MAATSFIAEHGACFPTARFRAGLVELGGARAWVLEAAPLEKALTVLVVTGHLAGRVFQVPYALLSLTEDFVTSIPRR